MRWMLRGIAREALKLGRCFLFLARIHLLEPSHVKRPRNAPFLVVLRRLSIGMRLS